MFPKCDFDNKEWVKKFSGLTYENMKTEIIGNVFYVLMDATKYDTKLGKGLHIGKKDPWKPIVSLPMVLVHECTIQEILIGWNFGVKYKWLYENGLRGVK